MTALLAAAVLLAGCSQTELGYFSLMMEISQLKSMRVEGNFLTTLDRGVVDSNPALKSDIGDEVVATLAQLGNQANLSYSGDVSTADGNAGADVKFYFNGGAPQDQQYLCNLILKDNNLYIDTKGLANVHNLVKTLSPDAKLDNLVMPAEAQGYDYALIQSFDTYAGDVSLNDNDIKSMRDLLTGVFKNFDTGLIQQSVNGYTLRVSAPQFVDCLVKAAVYLSDNSQAVYNVLNSNQFVKDNGGVQDDYQSFADSLTAMKESALSFRDSFNQEMADPQSAYAPYKDSYYFDETWKADGVYHSTDGIVGAYNGTEFCRFQNTVNITPKQVTITAPAADKVYKLDTGVNAQDNSGSNTQDNSGSNNQDNPYADVYSQYNPGQADGVYEVKVNEM